jgi:hypothetical protein
MKKLLVFIFMLSSYLAIGQAGLFQDGKGESAAKVFGNSIAISTKDESISFAAGNYYRTIHKTTFDRFKRWAVIAELRANEGLSNIKDGKDFLVDGNIGFYHGWKKVPLATATTSGWALERFISGSIGADRNKLFNTSATPKEMVYSKGEFVYKVELGQFGYKADYLYGVGVSFKQQTNVDDIKTKSVSFLDFISTNDSTMVFREKQAYDIKEFVGDQKVLSVNADWAILLNRKDAVGPGTAPSVFFAFHFRYQLLEHETGQFNPGIGCYLGKHGGPRNIIGGFNIQFLDILNGQNDDETNALDRATINFVVGFKL